MNINYLRKHEIIYELIIRDFGVNEKEDVNDLKFVLRKYITDNKPVSETAKIKMLDSDQKEIKDSLAEIQRNLDDFPSKDAKISERRILSRLEHLTGRVSRLQTSEIDGFDNLKKNTLDTCEVIQAKLSRLVKKLTHALSSTFLEGKHVVLQPSETDSDMESYDSFPIGNSPTGQSPVNCLVKKPSVPVYKWGLKFDGQGGTDAVLSFLERVDELRAARGISKEELFSSAIDLFSGPAVVWFRSIKSRVNSWDALEQLLRKNFLPLNSDDAIWKQIRERKQKPGESASLYIAHMENLFSRLSITPTMQHQILYIKQNLIPDFVQQLALFEIQSISCLADLCRKLEDAKLSQQLQPKIHVISESKSNADIATKFDVLLERINNLEKKIERDLKKEVNNNTNIATTSHSSTRQESKTKLICWNCRKPGHAYSECRNRKKTIFCYGCGQQGKMKNECDVCSKNESRERQQN